MQAENDVFVFLSYVELRSSLPQFSSPNKIGLIKHWSLHEATFSQCFAVETKSFLGGSNGHKEKACSKVQNIPLILGEFS